MFHPMCAMQHLSRFILIIVSICLSACSSGTQTNDPAKAYAATTVLRQQDGSLHVVAEWDYIEMAMAAQPPRMVAGGIKAHIVRGKPRYSHYYVKGVYQMKAGSMQVSEEDIVMSVKEHSYDRATLERAAQGTGLTVPLPMPHRQQTFSAGYVRGFLQKVDAAVRNPAAVQAKPITGPWYMERW